MKNLIFKFSVVFLLCLNVNLFAQVVTYTFRDSAGTYNEITGGNLIAAATHTSQDPGNLNDVTYGPFALPFIFTFNCLDYTSYYVNSNGFITFGPTAPGISNYNPVSSGEAYEGAVSAFGIDLIGVFGTTIDFSGVTNVLSDVRNFKGIVVGRHITAATGIPANTFITAMDTTLRTITISNFTTDIIVNDLVIQTASGSIESKTEGASPNRVHTIQFKNFRQYQIIGTDDNFNFQIKLYEPTYLISGAVHIVYGNMDKNSVPVPSVFGQVGLRGATNSDWNLRSNSSTLNWLSSTAGSDNAATSLMSSSVFPVKGLTYIWDGVCGILPVEMSSFTSAVNRRDVTLNWTTASETNNSRFMIERSSDNNMWMEAGSLNGSGSTQSASNYIFTDRGLGSGKYNYRLKQTDFNGNFEYFNLSNEVIVGIPEKFDLSQNYPNPFNPATTINYDIPADGKVTMKVFDVSGREVSELVNEYRTAGYYTVSFNGNDLSSGIYIYTLVADNAVLSKKMLLLK
ncbi:MAG TPA: T9SS type A sorting domain-containing protein [Ignavibacteria bacterium]|nr:T9SS type A sorting domain-containing protein [Ignavibacteria bacterium]